jgi:hypothetical protein
VTLKAPDFEPCAYDGGAAVWAAAQIIDGVGICVGVKRSENDSPSLQTVCRETLPTIRQFVRDFEKHCGQKPIEWSAKVRHDGQLMAQPEDELGIEFMPPKAWKSFLFNREAAVMPATIGMVYLFSTARLGVANIDWLPTIVIGTVLLVAGYLLGATINWGNTRAQRDWQLNGWD